MVSTRSKKTTAQISSPGLSSPDRPPRPASRGGSIRKAPVSSKKTPVARKPLSTSGTVYSSDEVEFSDADDSVASLAASAKSNRSTASNESSRSKIPLNIEKKLLAEIETSGGLFAFPLGEGLDKLLNDTEQKDEAGGNPFGDRGDAARRKYRRRIHYIRNNWTKEKYLLHLAWLKVDPFANLKKKGKSQPLPDKVTSNIPTSVNVNIPTSADAFKEEPSDPKPESLKTPVAAGAKSRASESENRHPAIIPTTPSTKMSGTFLDPETTGAMHALLVCIFALTPFCCLDNIIQIDTGAWKQPERLTVAKFTGKMMGGKQYQGYEIAVVVDPRDARAGLYKLETYGDEKPTHKFKYTRPAVEAAHYQNKDVYEKAQTCEAVQIGHSIQVTAYKKLPNDQKTETFTLVFPSSCKLTDRHFVPSGESVDEKEIENLMIMGKVDTGIKRMDKTSKTPVAVTNLSFIMTWRLTDMASEDDVMGGDDNKPKAARQMDEFFDGTP